jgi:hypothetical protein
MPPAWARADTVQVQRKLEVQATWETVVWEGLLYKNSSNRAFRLDPK